MGLKRPIFLISGTVIGTVGVLSYVPSTPGKGAMLALPPLKQSTAPTSQATPAAPNTPAAQTPVAATSTPAATPTQATAKSTTTKKSKKLTTKTPTKTQTQQATATQTPTQTPAPAPSPTKTQAPAPSATRTIDGATVQTPYGPVQVQITVQGTKITNAAALQTPQGGRSSWINQQAVPYLIQETLAAQSANIQGVGGATWTSQSWAQSLQSAISKM